MTELVFRDDAYAKSCEATILAVNDRGGIILDRTVFYATAGGQPGDTGVLLVGDLPVVIATTVYDADKNVIHVPAESHALPQPGEKVSAQLDWENRYKLMRCHTMMHLLCAAAPFPVTGSAITGEGGRIDFDIPEGQIPDKAGLETKINGWINEDHAVSTRWISEDELDANPDMVRTMFVKPPRGQGRIRLVEIGEGGNVDLQPCGGTHMRRTGEIGGIAVQKIENKGRINRRIRLALT